MNAISQLNHEGEFQRAWADPSNTRIELPPVDVNRVLADPNPKNCTKRMLSISQREVL